MSTLQLRAGFNGRMPRLMVVLMQQQVAASGGTDIAAAERAQELCIACELSHRSLFVLPNSDNMHGYVLRLEQEMHEQAQVGSDHSELFSLTNLFSPTTPPSPRH